MSTISSSDPRAATARFEGLTGGLFSPVAKADVGDGVSLLIERGCDILAWADPFFPDPSTPPSVTTAMSEAIQSGLIAHYTMPIGSLELRTAIAAKVKSYNGLDADPRRNVLVTPGSDSGLLYAMMPFLEAGDEVLVPDPSYPSNYSNCAILGAVPIPVPMDPSSGYQLDIAEMRKRLTPRTRMVLITHPNNPTGTVFRAETIRALSEFVVENNLILVSDQAFEDHIFDGIEFVSPASCPGMWDRTVTVFSVSKGLGLSGIRVGYVVASDRMMDTYYGAAVNVLGATSTVGQIGALAALRDNSILPEYFRILERRRTIAFELFDPIPGVVVAKAESGFLSWLNISALGSSAFVAAHLIEDAAIAVNQGEPYGAGGVGHIRLVHGCFRDDDKATAVLTRLADSLAKLAH